MGVGKGRGLSRCPNSCLFSPSKQLQKYVLGAPGHPQNTVWKLVIQLIGELFSKDEIKILKGNSYYMQR